jgi:hypothetical protein
MNWKFPLHIILIFLPLIISCDKEVFTGPPEEPPVQNAQIAIQSNPAGAKIWLNGKNLGITTPDTIKWLKTDSYVITLKLGLFKDSIFTANAVDNSLLSMYIDYYLNPGHFGKIECKSNPIGADILLNDVNTGFQTPHIFSGLFPGAYKIKLTYPEHRADSTVVTVRGGRTINYTAVMNDTTKWVTYNVSNSPIQANHISSIAADENNIKWIGSGDKGLARFDGKNWTIYNRKNSALPFDAINCITVDPQNNVWIGTIGGLIVISGSTWIDYTSKLPSSFVTSVAFDKSGRAWIGTNTGLVKYDGNTWQVFSVDNSGIAGNFVLSIAVDSKDRIWFGTNAFGIGMFDGIKWEVYNMSNMNLGANLGNGISSIAADDNGMIWAAHISDPLAYEDGGLSRFDGTHWKRILIPGVQVEQIEDIYVDGNNFKWLSTYGGVARFSQPDNPLIFTAQNSKLPVNQVKGIMFDKNGDLWFATFGGGLTKLKKGNF